jgi:lipopolysaccharide transport system ATP-binding protein
MGAVTRLCERVILLEKGKMAADGPANEVVKDYLGQSWQAGAERHWSEPHERPGNEIVRLSGVRVRTQDGATVDSISIQQPVGIELTYDVLQSGHVLAPKVDLVSEEGLHIFASHDVAPHWRRRPRPVGRYVSTMWVPGNFLAGGNLRVNVSVMSHHPATLTHFDVTNVVAFQVLDTFDGHSARGDYLGPIAGVVRPLLDWDTDFCAQNGEPEFPTGELTVSLNIGF